jgi:carbon-monoxide dehydrogenase medium subunit
MKPAPFEYACPDSLEVAIALLDAQQGNAMALSGGQSLMPVLAFRMATPALLVDLRNIPGLDRIDVGPDALRLGARVRWRDIEDDRRLGLAHPLLAQAISHVAHYQIRNRGTVGGSLAHADPAAEMPGIAVTCDAKIHVQGPRGPRTIPAGSFFLGPLSTALAVGELITAVELPAWRSGRAWGFEEFSRRRGDFAMAGIAAFFDRDGEGRVQDAHIGVIGACHQPHRLSAAEAILNGHRADEARIVQAARAAAGEVDPPSDLHAPADYRRALVETLTERALRRAAALS